MKKCLKCGAELDDGANFCRYCGSSQKVDSAEAIAQGYYAPNGMSQDYYDPNGTGLLCSKWHSTGVLCSK